MTVPTISNLPTVPATSDPNFETEAPALFNHIKNTFVSEMNSAISFINSSTFDATVEFKNANFTAARNFLYMIDTSSAAVSVTLPLNPSTGDQLLLMDQKRSFGTNNLTIGRNSQNINGAASDVVSKSTGALIRCIFQASYGWTVDLYEGEWESGTSAGDLVYNGGNVGIGTSSPNSILEMNSTSNTICTIKASSSHVSAIDFADADASQRGYIRYNHSDDSMQLWSAGSNRLTIDSTGNVGIGTTQPQEKLDVYGDIKLGSWTNDGVIRAWTSRGTDEGGNTTNGSNLILKAGIGTGSGTNGQIEFHTEHSTLNFGDGKPHGSGSAKMVIKSTGEVGIGTSSPGAKLHATGDIVAQNATNPTISANDNGTLGASDKSVYMRYDTTNDVGVVGSFHNGTGAKNLVLNQLGGNVGIGTNAPPTGYRLDVTGGRAVVRGSTEGVLVLDDSGIADASRPMQYISSDGGTLKLGNANRTTANGTTNSVNRMVIDSDGNVEVSTGNLVIGTAGKGIDFGVASGSVTSQLLDDYEEGTWGPVVADASSGGNTASGSFSGTYTKVGRIVTVHCYALNINTSGMTSTNSLVIRNLPFQNAGLIAKYGAVRLDSVTFSGYCVAQIGGSASHVSIIENKSGLSNSGLTVSDLTSGVSDIYFGLTYETS